MAKTEKSAASASQAKGSGKASAQQAEAGEESSAKSKGKKPLLIAVAVLVLAIGGGAGWYFTKGKSDHGEPAKKAAPEKLNQPKFVPLEAFTVNLQRGEEGDQFLQVGITLKIDDPDLEGKIKQAMPEIRSRILMLLSGKRGAELAPVSGKKQLAQEILLEVNSALGFKPAKIKEAVVHDMQGAASDAIAGGHAASGVAAHTGAASAPANTETDAEEKQAAEEEQKAEAEEEEEETQGILEVLFTSFIIQ